MAKIGLVTERSRVRNKVDVLVPFGYTLIIKFFGEEIKLLVSLLLFNKYITFFAAGERHSHNKTIKKDNSHVTMPCYV